LCCHRRHRVTLLLTASLALVAGEARAEEPTGEQEQSTQSLEFERLSLDALLNPTITTSTKSARTIEQSPSIVTLFGREDIERLGAHQLIDLLRYVPGFYEVGSGLERNVAIRGIHASSPCHFVVLLDGLPLNDFLFSSSSPDSFSLEFAERVEIIRGPGSAIYGANALMGVVNIITRKPEEMSLRQTISAGVRGELRADTSFAIPVARGGSFYAAGSIWRQGGTSFSAAPGEDVLVPSLGQNISDGIQAGENLTGPLVGARPGVNSYGPSYNLFMKYQQPDGSAIRLLIAQTDLHLQRTSRQGLYDPDQVPQQPHYINDRIVLDLEKRWGHADSVGQFTFRPSVLLFGHEMRSQVISPAYYTNTTREGTPVVSGWSGRDVRVSPSLEYAVDLPDLWIFRQNTLVAGVQPEYDVAYHYATTQCYVDKESKFPPSIYARDGRKGQADLFCVESLMLREGLTVDSFGVITEAGRSPLTGDGDELRLGTFFQLTTSLPRGIGLLLGGRVDYNVTYAPQFSPRVALVAPLGHGFYSKLQLSSAFVYPAFLYRTGNSLSDYQGNPDIKPQSVRTAEALVGFKSDHIRHELTGYYNDVSQFITFDLPLSARTGQFKFANEGDIEVVGVEATSAFRLMDGRLLVDLQGTFAKPLPSSSEQFLVDGQLGGPTKYPQLMGRAIVSVNPVHRLHLTLDGTVTSRVKQTIAREVQFEGIAGSDGKPYATAAASSFDTRELVINGLASYAVTDRWKITLIGSNLLDHRFYRPGSELVPYLAEGRRLTLTVSWTY
jgi:outer membrane receptor protein involved in Fe transport